MIQLSTTTGIGLTILEERSILINRLIPPWQQHHQRKKAHKKTHKEDNISKDLLETFLNVNFNQRFFLPLNGKWNPKS